MSLLYTDMLDFQQKRKIKRVLYSKTSIVVLAVLIFFLARSTYDIYGRQRLSVESFGESTREYESLKTREAHLTTSLLRLETEEGKEEEIRSKFGVAKPGEVVVTVIDDPALGSETAVKKGFWGKMMDWFDN